LDFINTDAGIVAELRQTYGKDSSHILEEDINLWDA
jgi:hypothetical protein